MNKDKIVELFFGSKFSKLLDLVLIMVLLTVLHDVAGFSWQYWVVLILFIVLQVRQYTFGLKDGEEIWGK